MDQDEGDDVVAGLRFVIEDLRASLDRLKAADEWLQEEKSSGDPSAMQSAEQEVAAAMRESEEKRNIYRELLELIRKYPESH